MAPRARNTVPKSDQERVWEAEGTGIVERVGTGVKPERRNRWYCWKIRPLKVLLLIHMLIPFLHKDANNHHKLPK